MKDQTPKQNKPLYIAAAAADRLLGLVTFVLAAVMLLYGVYVLYDTAYLNHKAFVSQDLMQYKPDVEATDELLGFSDMLDLNPNTVGWLNVFDTNIDHPVMQGKDNMEYLNKDPYGEFSLSGSIYLDVDNDGALTDRYNIIFGHHMANGAMFGDIAKYLEEDFFLSHQDGLLQTPARNYDLRVFAVVRSSAYDQTIYSPPDRNSIDYLEHLLSYVADRALWYDAASAPDPREGKVAVLSTCADAYTNGRIMLFCSLLPRQLPLEREPAPEPVHREAVGHGENKWSLLDLCCTVLTVLILLPLTYIRKKYRQIGYSRRTADRLEQLTADAPLAVKTTAELGKDYIPGVIKALRRFHDRMLGGAAVEALAAAGAVILFLLTQDLTCPMTLVDKWTPLFLAVAAAAWLTDYICFRYRGDRPPAEEETEAAH